MRDVAVSGSIRWGRRSAVPTVRPRGCFHEDREDVEALFHGFRDDVVETFDIPTCTLSWCVGLECVPRNVDPDPGDAGRLDSCNQARSLGRPGYPHEMAADTDRGRLACPRRLRGRRNSGTPRGRKSPRSCARGRQRQDDECRQEDTAGWVTRSSRGAVHEVEVPRLLLDIDSPAQNLRTVSEAAVWRTPPLPTLRTTRHVVRTLAVNVGSLFTVLACVVSDSRSARSSCYRRW